MSSGRPEWAPEEGAEGFACRVMNGVTDAHDGMDGLSHAVPPTPVVRRAVLTPEDYTQGILAGDRSILSRAITLVESNAAKHFEAGQEVIQRILPHTGGSVRVGITGVPGAGKSTFIEALGTMLCSRGKRVAVLAVDPSSTVTGGSILGDKTRMENLAREQNAFIRPSPSSGTLGGLARKSRETMLLCEAAGYDVILVETVGVGQSETTVRSMVDFFLLLVITGAGDELQGMKKGVMELADAILVNKADGTNELKAASTRVEYDRILHYLRPATKGWTTRAYTCSSVTKKGIDEIWSVVESFMEVTRASGVLGERRSGQSVSWMHGMVEEYVKSKFFGHPQVADNLRTLEALVAGGDLSATQAARRLIDLYEQDGSQAAPGKDGTL